MSMIREAILRETMRGGQVYYLHNECHDYRENRAKGLQKIIPEAQIRYCPWPNARNAIRKNHGVIFITNDLMF